MCNCGNQSLLGSIFNNSENTEILLFLIVFLLLFTTFGKPNNDLNPNINNSFN